MSWSGWILQEMFTWYERNPLLNNEERSVKALENINKALDKHQSSLERESYKSNETDIDNYRNREPQYINPPEIIINTDKLADAQYEISDRLNWIFNAQRDLVQNTNENNSLQKRLVLDHGVTNDLLNNLATSWNKNAVDAYNQRDRQLRELSSVSQILWKNWEIMKNLLWDIWTAVTSLTNEQILTRMSVVQALQSVQSTFMQTHENEMLSHQRTQNLLQEILFRSWQTEQEKQARKTWEKAEFLRQQWNIKDALIELQNAYNLDDMNPQILLSSATIHSSLWNFEKASDLFIKTEQLAEFKWPHMNSYILMNLASNLMELGRYNHAERVMYKAVRNDPLNREAWFKYAIIAWKTRNKKNTALVCLKQLLQLNPVYYKAQIIINPDLEDLRDLLKKI